MQLGTAHCTGAVFVMTSNLGSEEIKLAAPKLHKLVAATEDRHEQYLKDIGQFNQQLYPILKESLKRDEFLGRINRTVIFLPFNDQEVSDEIHSDIKLIFYCQQISQIIKIELTKWKKRAEEQHGIRLSWSPQGKFECSSAISMTNFGVENSRR